MHQRCECSGRNACKSFCDNDSYCKGYVSFSTVNNCQIATTSACPFGCSKYDVGNVGDLDENVSCENPKYYDGCFIKSSKLK